MNRFPSFTRTAPVLALAVLMAPSLAHAFELTRSSKGWPIRWCQDEVMFTISTANIPDELSVGLLRQAAEEATAAWNAVDGCDIPAQSVAAEETDDPDGGFTPVLEENRNTITFIATAEKWAELGLPEGAIAWAKTVIDERDGGVGVTVDADIFLQVKIDVELIDPETGEVGEVHEGSFRVREEDCHDGTPPGEGETGPTHYDLVSTLVHEIGHTLGLAHSDVPGAVMNPVQELGTCPWRTVRADSTAGMCEIYVDTQCPDWTLPPPPDLGPMEADATGSEGDSGAATGDPGAVGGNDPGTTGGTADSGGGGTGGSGGGGGCTAGSVPLAGGLWLGLLALLGLVARRRRFAR